jgi:hypothetical protein
VLGLKGLAGWDGEADVDVEEKVSFCFSLRCMDEGDVCI